jgi:Cu/Zn superoxide dismutase
MMRDGTGTHVELSLTGLDPATTYGAHVHALPCAVNTGGGHYMLDPTVVGVVEENELWPQVTGHEVGGSMTSTYNSPHLARYDAQSVVVHRVVVEGEPPPKVACADLVRPSYPGAATSGDAQVLPGGQAKSLTITGSATMSRTLAGVTQLTLNAAGLEANAEYGVHVHAMPCSVGEAGGHYKFDTAVADPVETNEIWLKLSTDASGAASDTGWVNHLARGDAQSLVIHDAEKTKMACFDLER